MKPLFISLCFLIFPFGLSAQQNINGSFVHKGYNRTYIVHIPPTYSGLAPVPLVLNLHGRSMWASLQQTYSNFDAVSDTAGFIVVYPNGINYVWDTVFVNSPIDDAGFLSELIDTVSKKYNIDSLRVFSTGMSMGGFMTYRLASELSGKIAAVASVAGPVIQLILDSCNNTPPVPVLHFHGTADSIIPYNGEGIWPSVDTLIQYFINKNNCPVLPVITAIPDTSTSDSCTVTKYRYGFCDDSTEVVLYKITNGGHTWPGLVPLPSLGNTDRDILASVEIWNFFKTHKLKQSIIRIEKNEFEKEINFFPNPANGKINLKISLPIIIGMKIENIGVYNVLGEKVIEVAPGTGTHFQIGSFAYFQIDISDKPKGIYIGKIRFGDTMLIRKIVLQ